MILEVQSEVPRLEEVLRWHGEPVKALLLPTSAFLTNRRGYPTLSKAHQELLTRFFQLGVQASDPLQCCTLTPKRTILIMSWEALTTSRKRNLQAVLVLSVSGPVWDEQASPNPVQREATKGLTCCLLQKSSDTMCFAGRPFRREQT